METQEIRVHKSSFRIERDTFYSDWTIAFWREFFQNSVDAGAKNIAITLSTEKARGSFNLNADADEDVTRIVFDDDGKGMTADVIKNVYFAIGESTKRAEAGSVGGFGRARLMTCFSQKRYSILTGDNFVMGDGAQYVVLDLAQAKEAVEKALDKLFYDGTDSTIRGLSHDSEIISTAAKHGGQKGCRVEVDLDHVRTQSWHRMPTEAVMAQRLKEYLSESQIPANVTINGKTPEEYFGVDGKLQARRGRVERILSAVTDQDGEIEFATIHQTENANASHKGKMIVRVDGASMYAEAIDAPEVQVILEIKTNRSREVLNSNRDGIRNPYKAVVSKFIQELATENISALREKKGKTSYKLSGDQGMLLSSKAVDLQKLVEARITEDELKSLSKITITAKPQEKSKYQTVAAIKNAGVAPDAIVHFVDNLRWNTGLSGDLTWKWEVPSEVKEQIDTFRNKAIENSHKPVETFIEEAPAGFRDWVVDTLADRIETARDEIRKEEVARLKDQTDIYMEIVSTNEKTKAAIARHHPRKWDAETGKGRILKAQLAAWTAVMGLALETLRTIRPAMSDFNWMTGFVFAVPEQTYEGDASRRRPILAQFIRDADAQANIYLFNPFDEDGSLAHRLSDPKDRRRFMANALHEASHTTVPGGHNEAYALTLTDLLEAFDFDEANRRMRAAEKAVAAAYGQGRARVQPMDDEPGPRPAERLLSVATGNQPNWGAVDYAEDGTYAVDCDRVADHATEDGTDEDEEYGIGRTAR